MPRIIPVIDVMDGVVVQAIGGRRETYRPIRSSIVDSTEPLKVAEAMLAKTGSQEIYIADLDAIRGSGVPSPNVIRLIQNLNATVWLDHGIRSGIEMRHHHWRNSQCNIIVGSETCLGPDALRRVLDEWPVDRVAFSEDFFDGGMLADFEQWGFSDPLEFDERAFLDIIMGIGLRKIIYIDQVDVGCYTGGLRSSILRELKSTYADLQIIAGGGIRNQNDIVDLAHYGVDAVLIASAIHNGQLP